MTWLVESTERPAAARTAAAVAAPVVLAVGALAVAGLNDAPTIALVVVAALIAVPLMLRHPSAVLVLMIVVQVGNLSVVADAGGVPDTFLGLTLVAAACVGTATLRDGHRPAWSPVLLFGAIYAALRLLSTLQASDLPAAASAMQGLIGDLVLIALLLALCRRHRGELAVGAAAVTTAAVLCLLEILRQFVVGNDVTFGGLLRPATIQDVGLTFPRHTGPVTDFNFWGRILVLILPFSFSLFVDRSFGAHRWWWLGSSALLLGGIYLTGSRGALLAAGVVVVAWLAVSGPRYRRLLLGLPLVLVCFVLVPGVGSRLASIADVTTTSAGSADESLTGRLGALQAGLHMIVEHPLLGVGPDNFISAFPLVARQYGIDSLVLAPHNMYLQIAAESGLPALVAWIAFLGAGLFVAVRARCLLGTVRTPSGIPSPEAMLASAAIASLVGWIVAGVVLHVDNLRILAIPLVVAASLDISARRSAAARLGEPGGWQPGMMLDLPSRVAPPRRRRHLLLPALVAIVVALPTALAVGVTTERWTTTSQVTLDVAPGRGELDSYTVEVLNRAPLSSTYLGVLSDAALVREAGASAGLPPAAVDGATVTASATSDPTSMTLSVTTGSAPTSSALATATAQTTTARFRSLNPLFTLSESGTDDPVRTLRPKYDGLAVVAVATMAAFVVTWMVRRRPDRMTTSRASRQRGTRPIRERTPSRSPRNRAGAQRPMPTR